MSTIFESIDELGPARTTLISEQRTGLRAIVVVDNVAAGPALGGVRMAPDVTFDECRSLARAMTLKNAMAGLSHGGGKAVIAADPRSDGKQDLIRAFADSIATMTEYIPGPDMGTDEECMAWIHDEIGRCAGLPEELGGIPLDKLGATAAGLVAAIEVAAPHLEREVDGSRVVIHGYGAVGRPLAHLLGERGATIVGVADSRGATAHPEGLDLTALDEAKKDGLAVDEAGTGEPIAIEDLIGIDCDIWVPAARPATIRADNVDRLRARLVVEAANVPTTADADARLNEAGVMCLPDFVVNAGGVICGATEYVRGTRRAAFDAIDDRIRANMSELVAVTDAQGGSLRDHAVRIARERLARAGATRRWN